VRLTGALPPWKIVLLKQQFGDRAPERADLLTAANVFNEFFWKSKAPLGMRAVLTARQLLGYLNDNGSIFLMEPGDPRSGTFISAVRAALATFGLQPESPCPHANACPMPGLFHSLQTPGETVATMDAKNLPAVVMPKRRDKYPWCHFTIGTEAAPNWLKTLSDEAGLPKEKLVFSYLLSSMREEGPFAKAAAPEKGLVRIVSEEFALPEGKAGRYACSADGYSLVRYSPVETTLSSGDLIRAPQSAQKESVARKPPENSDRGHDHARASSYDGKSRDMRTRDAKSRNQPPRGKGEGRRPQCPDRTHFAESLDQSQPGTQIPSGTGQNLDEKSGAKIISY
jgi:hypothetical protein